jgi:L-Ala-D/L-Glu epimerase / N-acetyl-D-glutamate racemase
MIRVVSAEAVPITFRLREGYRIAGASFTEAYNVILKVTTSDGRTGFGCAAPAEEVTGESPAACLHALRDLLIPLLRESDALDLGGFGRRAERLAPGCPAARAAADIALHDLMGLREGRPLVDLLGRRRNRMPTSVTLGIERDPGATLERARRHVAAGFRILKIKTGENWEADARLIGALRGALPPGILLRADGNQGYSEDEARRFLEAIGPGDLELLEQPTPAGDPRALARLAAAFEVPIMADEAVQSPRDLDAILQAGGADLVNIKLMKAGGIVAGAAIAAKGAASGIGAMVGCNDESRISIAAGLHLALSAPGVERADLDGHLDLADDVARGGVEIESGELVPLDKPGLGVTVDL